MCESGFFPSLERVDQLEKHYPMPVLCMDNLHIQSNNTIPFPDKLSLFQLCFQTYYSLYPKCLCSSFQTSSLPSKLCSNINSSVKHFLQHYLLCSSYLYHHIIVLYCAYLVTHSILPPVPMGHELFCHTFHPQQIPYHKNLYYK